MLGFNDIKTNIPNSTSSLVAKIVFGRIQVIRGVSKGFRGNFSMLPLPQNIEGATSQFATIDFICSMCKGVISHLLV